MKRFLSIALSGLAFIYSANLQAQDDKSKRPSPPATVTRAINGSTITIHYSQPSVNGREIGKELEPKEGKIWRTGANEATVFETDSDIKIEGKPLPMGKYALFTIKNGNDWTIIFNKNVSLWGAFGYKEAEDVLRVQVKGTTASDFAEKMNFTISETGKVTLRWGALSVAFQVEAAQ